VKRVVGSVVGLVVVAFVLCVPAFFYGGGSVEPNTETTTISDYQADFTVAKDGDLTVTETLSVDFPDHGKHGIFRFWDLADPNDPHARRTPTDIAVTMDGSDEPFTTDTEDHGRFRVAKIGDPDSTLDPGVHVYVLTYRIDGVLDANSSSVTGADERSMFYWNLIPQGWQQSIDKAELTVHLPVAAQPDVKCAIGSDATPCDVQGGGTRDLTIDTGAIPARTPVTVATALDLATPPAGNVLPWAPRWDRVLGTHLPVLVAVVLLALAALVVGSVLGARSRERAPGFPLTYAPPDGVGPAQAKYVMDEDVDNATYVATLMWAAEKGAVDLERDGKSWTVKDKNGPEGWKGLDPVTVDVAHLLGGPQSTFTATPKSVKAGERLKDEIERFERNVKQWGRGSGNLVGSGLGPFGGLLVTGGFILVLVCAIWNPLGLTAVGLIPGAFAVGGVSLAATGASTRRTRSGRQLWSQVGGFKRILATPSSKDRFDFSGRKELYTAYVPWAVAFGCADEWAKKYRVETGEEPPVPHYFAGAYVGANASAYVDSMVDSFSTTVDNAISSYNATQSSSSSGGGGFSGGGGGGGGGGGSW
jgi:hypothetical protein